MGGGVKVRPWMGGVRVKPLVVCMGRGHGWGV